MMMPQVILTKPDGTPVVGVMKLTTIGDGVRINCRVEGLDWVLGDVERDGRMKLAHSIPGGTGLDVDEYGAIRVEVRRGGRQVVLNEEGGREERAGGGDEQRTSKLVMEMEGGQQLEFWLTKEGGEVTLQGNTVGGEEAGVMSIVTMRRNGRMLRHSYVELAGVETEGRFQQPVVGSEGE